MYFSFLRKHPRLESGHTMFFYTPFFLGKVMQTSVRESVPSSPLRRPSFFTQDIISLLKFDDQGLKRHFIDLGIGGPG